MMVLPGAASARTDCSTSDVQLAGGAVGVTAGGPGTSGQADAAVGACVNAGAQGDGSVADQIDFFGGLVEVGAGADGTGPTGVYGVIDGDDQNTAVSPQGGGYAGVSNFETSPPADECDGVDEPFASGGTNSGGCFTVRGVAFLPVPLLACGNTTGPSWDAAGRDGCTIP